MIAPKLFSDNYLCVPNENAGFYLFLFMSFETEPATLDCMEWPVFYDSGVEDTGLKNYLCNFANPSW